MPVKASPQVGNSRRENWPVTGAFVHRQHGIQKTKKGIPVLLEFIMSKETKVSRPGTEGLSLF
jgi:hypothetical protein